ncbi:MAG TPA: HAMP domain-containing protein, partial [Bacilli bacterium]|nr:HAMP domain-containing protein [Bacilli bacterium]
MMNGIRKRVVFSFLFVIILIVVLFEAIIFLTIRYYYLENIKEALKNQGAIFANYYEHVIESQSFLIDSDEMLNDFQFQLEVQAQLINEHGYLLADTFPSLISENLSHYPDVKEALTGAYSTWIGSKDDTHSKVLALSYPLRVGDEVKGAIRLSTSLEPFQQFLFRVAIFLMLIGCIVIFIGMIVSVFLSKTIVEPVKTIQRAAKKMASGQFSERITYARKDELGDLAETLNFMASEVERHEKVKNEFIASISHELRTPLTSIKGWGMTLQSMAKEPIFKEGLDLMSQEADRLVLLVEDLLDFSSLSSMQIQLSKQEVELTSLLKQIIWQLKPRAERQDIRLRFVQLNNFPPVQCDPDRMKQVFINLLDNALKFTNQSGDIWVTLEAADSHLYIQIQFTIIDANT